MRTKGQFIVSVLFLSQLFFSSGSRADVGGIFSLQNWQNNSYQAICDNGSFEVLSVIDLQINNACPRKDPNRANNILTLTHLQDGKFDVTCTDLTRTTTDAAAIIDASVCADHASFIDDKGIDSSISVQSRSDGQFNMICEDGSREVLSPLDLRLNNVCPKQALPPEKRSMLAAYRQAVGKYSVFCADKSEKTMTVAELRAGSPCTAPAPLGPKTGQYSVESGNSTFCPQRLVPTYSGSVLVAATIGLLSPCGGSLSLTCANNVCTGKNGSYSYTMLPKDETHYDFSELPSRLQAIFKWDHAILDFSEPDFSVPVTVQASGK